MSDWTLARPVFSCKGLADDDDRWRTSVVAVEDKSTDGWPDADGAKVITARRPPLHAALGGIVATLDRHREIPASRQRERRRRPGAQDAWCRTQALERSTFEFS